MNNLIVSKSNRVIEASYKLSLNEQRVLLCCISQVDSRDKLFKDQEFLLDAKSYADTFNLELKNAYVEIKEAADNLFERYIWIKNSKNGAPIKTRWLSSIEYRDGSILLNFAPKVCPYLSNLSTEFTSYRLSNISRMTSLYAIRLYELLIRWKRIGQTEFKLDSLRESFQIKESDYKRMFDFKKRVLHVAIDQINEHTDINCYYKDIKKGRKIIGFKFHFGENCPTQIELEEAIASIPQ